MRRDRRAGTCRGMHRILLASSAALVMISASTAFVRKLAQRLKEKDMRFALKAVSAEQALYDRIATLHYSCTRRASKDLPSKRQMADREFLKRSVSRQLAFSC